MTKLEEIESSLLDCMEPEIDETLYAGGLMRDDVLAALARAAVKAMMTPSKGMIAACGPIYHASGAEVWEADPAEIWRAMCRAILDETPT